jgi:hypothetical protein
MLASTGCDAHSSSTVGCVSETLGKFGRPLLHLRDKKLMASASDPKCGPRSADGRDDSSGVITHGCAYCAHAGRSLLGIQRIALTSYCEELFSQLTDINDCIDSHSCSLDPGEQRPSFRPVKVGHENLAQSGAIHRVACSDVRLDPEFPLAVRDG